MSVDKVLNIAKTISTLKIKLPISGETMTKTMILTNKHRSIEALLDEKFWKTFRVTHCQNQKKEGEALTDEPDCKTVMIGSRKYRFALEK